MSENELFSRLKKDSFRDHLRCEKKFPLFDAETNTTDYKNYLLRLYPLHLWFEGLLTAHKEILPSDLKLRARCEKSKWLHQDLSALGCAVVPIEEAKSTFPTYMVDDVATLLGLMYVFEGATLGGQVISKILRKNLQLEETQLNYFKGYAANTGLMWKDFIQVASSVVTSQDYDQLLAGTTLGFQMVYDRM